MIYLNYRTKILQNILCEWKFKIDIYDVLKMNRDSFACV